MGNLGEKLPKVSSPNRRNSRFWGDDWRRRVGPPLWHRASSEICAFFSAWCGAPCAAMVRL